VPTTAGRSRGRQGMRSRTPGAAGEHLSKIMTSLITGSVVVILVLVMTKDGRDIDAATQRFMLFYAGVFALIGLTASVGVGLIATDRIIMTPGHRVMAQAVHRAVSFGALAFLVIHIVTEILAQRVHVIDAFVPFLSPYRTFYIGLGTIASDLILLVVVTSIFRKRFTAHGKAWRWRAIHYTSYLAFVFGVLHGLLGGRTAKPYVDWSYGFAIALTALALVVRFLAISLRPKESLSAPPSADRASGGLGYSGGSPLRAAALGMAQAQLGGTVQVLPATAGLPGNAVGLPGGVGLPGSQDWAALPPPPGWSPSSGPFPAISASPAYGAYQDAVLMPLGAPVYGEGMAVGPGSYPYVSADPPRPALTSPGSAARAMRQPRYEPGYDGPPRFEGAPRKHVPQDEVSSYPYGSQGYRPSPGAGNTDRDTASRSRAGRPAALSSSSRPPQPVDAPQPDRNTGPIPRAGTGPMPRAGTGPMPRACTGPMPRAGTGPMPRADTGPLPRAGSGPMPRAGTGPMPRADTGPLPRAGTGPLPRAGSGPMPRAGTGPMPRADTGPLPRAGTGPNPRASTEPGSTARVGPWPRADSPSGARTGPTAGAPRRSRRADSAGSGYRDIPGRSGGAGWE
jgi:DMSO/TMAO reductase YedYZ heme-binding membrane subunit